MFSVSKKVWVLWWSESQREALHIDKPVDGLGREGEVSMAVPCTFFLSQVNRSPRGSDLPTSTLLFLGLRRRSPVLASFFLRRK